MDKFLIKKLLTGLLLIPFLLSGCVGVGSEKVSFPVPANPPIAKPKPVTQEVYVSLNFVGDIMAHSPQTRAAFNAQKGSYDFSANFTEIQSYLSASDFTQANLETPLAGENLKFTGFPKFNAPKELAQALKDAGVDLVTTANNHALDRGETGIINTLNNLDRIGLLHTGTFRSPEERNQVLVEDINQIKVAFLAYTYGTNGIPRPKGKAYLVNFIDPDLIKQDIHTAKAQGADLVVVSLHFGQEYHRQPNQSQQDLAKLLVANGADIIVGSHPHVQQPMEMWQTTGLDGKPRQALVIYSLGNFLSNQRDRYTDAGMIVQVKLEKNLKSGVVKIAAVKYMPTWVYRYYQQGQLNYQVLPVGDPTAPVSGGASVFPNTVLIKLKQIDRDILQLIPGKTTEDGWIVPELTSR